MSAPLRLVNRTRRSPSIPRKLLREGKLHLLPLYSLARLSCLGAEGIEHSGSYRFADHIYAGRPKGSFGVGRLIDALLLSLPATRSFRNRFFHCRDEVCRRLLAGGRPEPRVLSVPSGLPRDLIEAARRLPPAFGRARFYCLDLDPAVLAETRALLDRYGLASFELIEADAFDEAAWPADLDLITSTGFGEFLSDADLVRFYGVCFRRLRSGGALITSATVRNRLSDYLMRNLAELFTQYRDENHLRALFAHTPFRNLVLRRDAVGYQVLATAEKVL